MGFSSVLVCLEKEVYTMLAILLRKKCEITTLYNPKWKCVYAIPFVFFQVNLLCCIVLGKLGIVEDYNVGLV